MSFRKSVLSGNHSGPILSKYRLNCEIATSHSSVVHIAFGREDDKEYALKFTYRHHREVLRDRRVDTRDIYKIDPRSLDHPNILRYYDLIATDDLQASVTQYCPGGTLEDFVLEPSNNYTNANINKFLNRLAPLFYQMTSACDYLHREKQMVHGNITLTNIFLVDAKRTKAVLGDLGRLSHIKDQPTSTQREFGSYIGTSIYMAPEVIAGGPLSAKSDVYALGTCLFVSLDSSGPFDDHETTADRREYLSLVEQAIANRGADIADSEPLLALDTDSIQGPVLSFFDKTVGMSPEARPTCQELLKDTWLVDSQSEVGRVKAEDDASRLFICSEDGMDPNFELAKVFACTLMRRQPLRIIGCVSGLAPTRLRARLVKGTLVELGNESIPVAYGEDKVQSGEATPHAFEFDAPFLAKESDLYAGSGLELMHETMMRSPDKTVTFVCHSGALDVWKCLKTYPELFSRKVSRVVMRAAVEVEKGVLKLSPKGHVLPDVTGQPDVEKEALTGLFAKLQDLGVNMTICTRYMSYAVDIPFTVYEAMGHTKHPVALRLLKSFTAAQQHFWFRCCLPPDDPRRADLPKHTNKEWFCKMFLNGKGMDRDGKDQIIDLVQKFQSLTCLQMLAAVTDLENSEFFKPTQVTVKALDSRPYAHYIIGLSSESHGVVHPEVVRDYIVNALLTGFTGTDSVQQHLLIVSDDGKDQDDELAKVLLNALEGRQLATCKTFISCLYPAVMRARLAKGTLDSLGLTADVGIGANMGTPKDASYEFDVEYMADEDEVQTDGVALFVKAMQEAQDGLFTLVILSGMRDCWELFRDHTELFRKKIARVVIMGGVENDKGIVKFNEAGFMTPDSASNNLFDMEAAQFFYEGCQKESIPLTIVSRQAAYAAKLPLSLYDKMAETMHCVGIRLQKAQQKSLEHLWFKANAEVGSAEREGLPARCDKNWFCDTFLAGRGKECTQNDSIWSLTSTFQAYDPIALLAALPGIRDRYLDPAVFPIHGDHGVAVHEVMGLHGKQVGVRDPKGLVSWLMEAVMEGISKNGFSRQLTNSMNKQGADGRESVKHVREFAQEYAKQAPRIQPKQYALMKHLEVFSFERGWL